MNDTIESLALNLALADQDKVQVLSLFHTHSHLDFILFFEFLALNLSRAGQISGNLSLFLRPSVRLSVL